MIILICQHVLDLRSNLPHTARVAHFKTPRMPIHVFYTWHLQGSCLRPYGVWTLGLHVSGVDNDYRTPFVPFHCRDTLSTCNVVIPQDRQSRVVYGEDIGLMVCDVAATTTLLQQCLRIYKLTTSKMRLSFALVHESAAGLHLESGYT